MTLAESAPAPIPKERFEKQDFIEACAAAPSSLVYFVINVGDGDNQLILLPTDPEDPADTRRALVVDVATNDKLPALIESLEEQGLFPERETGHEFPIVVGTHPHDDHIAGMPQFLAWFGEHIAEYWDSAIRVTYVGSTHTSALATSAAASATRRRAMPEEPSQMA